MYFDFFAIGETTPTKARITETQLASYIASDWLPSAPLSLINGLVDVICTAIYPEVLESKNTWCVNPELAMTDRQWSSMTSWILGVAFTRFFVEQERYPWWSPVSAFRGPSSTGMTRTGHWSVPLPRSQFSVARKAGATSKLLPDYLTCRLNQNRVFEFAFVESKGTNRSIDSWTVAPSSWVNQSQSAELFYGMQSVQVKRNIVVATRINPHAKKVFNRRISVRAWNRKDALESVNPVVFAHYLANHYAATCWRTGYRRLGQLMEIVGMSMINENGVNQDFLKTEVIKQELETELDILIEPENRVSGLNVRTGPAILNRVDEPLNVSLGPINLTARLTRSALQIMRAIVLVPASELAQNIEPILSGITDLREILEFEPNKQLAVTLNGVAVFDRNLLYEF